MLLAELMHELENREWDVLLGTETWREEQEEGLTLPGGHRFLGGGGVKGRGVAIVLHERWKNAVQGRRAVSERLAWLDVTMHGKKLRLIAVYFPHMGYSEAEVEALYNDLSKVCGDARRAGRKVLVGGDFKAAVGVAREEDPAEAVGKFGYGERNHRGHNLVR